MRGRVARLSDAQHRLRAWAGRHRGLVLWGRRSVSALVVMFAGYYLWRNIAANADTLVLKSLRPNWALLLTTTGISVLCIGLGGWVWQLLLGSLGYTVSLGACFRIHASANLTKYLPGYAWQIMGKAYLTHREGVPTRVVAVAIALEFGLLLMTGLILVLFIAPQSLLAMLAPLPTPRVRLVMGLALTASTLCLPRLFNWIGEHVTAIPLRETRIVAPARLVLALAVICVAWVALGLGLGLTIVAFAPLADIGWRNKASILIISFLVSLVVIVVPAGIGVRESVMTFALTTHVGAPTATIVAVASRLVLVASEIAAIGMVWGAAALRSLRNRLMTQRD